MGQGFLSPSPVSSKNITGIFLTPKLPTEKPVNFIPLSDYPQNPTLKMVKFSFKY